MKRTKKLLPLIMLLPGIIGVWGYYKADNTILDSVYYSIGLYGMNLNGEVENIWLEFARWMAPLVTAATILTMLKTIYIRMKNRIICLNKDSTAIYSKTDMGELLNEMIDHSFLAGSNPSKFAKEHVIILGNDLENLSFYKKNWKVLQEKKVYLCLEEIDSNLLIVKKKEDDNSKSSSEKKEEKKEDNAIFHNNNLMFFNKNDVIAREFWKKHIFLAEKKWNCEEIHIGILGFENLGQRILYYGLLLNIVSLNQKIVYHIFGNSELHETTEQNIKSKLMNQDNIVFYGKNCPEQWELLKSMNVIIVTELPRVELLQGLVYRCKEAKIWYFSPNEEHIPIDRLEGFGNYSKVFTEENIKTDSLYKDAKKLNYSYVLKSDNNELEKKVKEWKDNNINTIEEQKEYEWKKISAFKRGSNISASDYKSVIQEINKNQKIEIIELAELEHIRWCRYHFLNHWEYSSARDDTRQLHSDLCSFSQLSKESRKKDADIINQCLQSEGNDNDK